MYLKNKSKERIINRHLRETRVLYPRYKQRNQESIFVTYYLLLKGKSPTIKRITDSNNKNNIPSNSLDAVPSLKDLEFSCTGKY